MPVARVNDIELHYKLEGDGEDTIVLVNGLADDLETWVLQVDDFLAAGYRVLRFDNRGIEASVTTAKSWSLRDMADDVHDLLETLGLTGRDDVHAAGWSMGGGVLPQEKDLINRLRAGVSEPRPQYRSVEDLHDGLDDALSRS